MTTARPGLCKHSPVALRPRWPLEHNRNVEGIEPLDRCVLDTGSTSMRPSADNPASVEAAMRACRAACSAMVAPRMRPAAKTPSTDVAPRASTTGRSPKKVQPSACSNNGSSAQSSRCVNGTEAMPAAASIQIRPVSACQAVASGRAITRAAGRIAAAAMPAGPAPITTTVLLSVMTVPRCSLFTVRGRGTPACEAPAEQTARRVDGRVPPSRPRP